MESVFLKLILNKKQKQKQNKNKNIKKKKKPAKKQKRKNKERIKTTKNQKKTAILTNLASILFQSLPHFNT